MSEDYVHIIPAEPGRVPDADKRQSAVSYFRDIAPGANDVTTWAKNELEFIDCGGNFGKITCPSCGQLLHVDRWNDWMNSDAGEDGFHLSERAMPCCGVQHTLHELLYEWPQGFARCDVCARKEMDPKI